MRKTILFLLCVWGCGIQAQTLESNPVGYRFTDTKVLPCTSVKNQEYSGTCWSFAGLSFIESEIMRMGKDSVNLSPMWVVRCAYIEKAVKFVRMHGKGVFSPGGATGDVFNMIRKYGLVPQEAYPGLNYGSREHKHAELDAALRGYITAIARDPNKGLTTAWLPGFEAILDVYMGPAPKNFVYRGKTYTPESFRDFLGVCPDDYVALTSFTHHPFYTPFAIEVEDNWDWGMSWNLPLDEFAALFEQTIQKGYSIYWCADVTEASFASTKGFATIPKITVENVDPDEKEKYLQMNPVQQRMFVLNKRRPGKEIEITQELRQKGFDTFATTDDHGMHIIGIGTDQIGNKYCKVKNSWGARAQDNEGFFYASYPYVAYKTVNMVIHKKALPENIRKKFRAYAVF